MSTASSPLTTGPSAFFSPYNKPTLPPLSIPPLSSVPQHYQSTPNSYPPQQPHGHSHHSHPHPHPHPYQPHHSYPSPPQHQHQQHQQQQHQQQLYQQVPPPHAQMNHHHNLQPHPYLNSGPAPIYVGPIPESRRKTPSSWDPHDDLLLRHLKEQLKLGWKEIAAYFPNRTTNACQFRWRRLVSGTLRSSGASSGSGTPTGQPLSPNSNSPIIENINDNNNINRRSSSIGSNSNPLQNYQPPSYEQQQQQQYFPSQPPQQLSKWTKEQDDLLRSRQDLRHDELSLLLGVSEQEIKLRVEHLDNPTSITSSPPLSTISSTTSTAPTTGSSTPSTTITAPAKSLANYQLSTPTSNSSDSVTIVDQDQDTDSGNEDGVPRSVAGRSRAGSHPRPLLPRKFSGSHFDGLKLPVPVVQRPGSISEPSPSSTAAATPTITPSTPATPVGGFYPSAS